MRYKKEKWQQEQQKYNPIIKKDLEIEEDLMKPKMSKKSSKLFNVQNIVPSLKNRRIFRPIPA